MYMVCTYSVPTPESNQQPCGSPPWQIPRPLILPPATKTRPGLDRLDLGRTSRSSRPKEHGWHKCARKLNLLRAKFRYEFRAKDLCGLGPTYSLGHPACKAPCYPPRWATFFFLEHVMERSIDCGLPCLIMRCLRTAPPYPPRDLAIERTAWVVWMQQEKKKKGRRREEEQMGTRMLSTPYVYSLSTEYRIGIGSLGIHVHTSVVVY